MTNDGLLLKQIQDGDMQAFDAIYEKYWAYAYTSAYRRLKDDEQAKDIVQEVFIHIWAKRSSLQIANLPAYLNIAIRNRVFKTMARQKDIHPFLDILENLPATYLQADSNLLWKEFFISYEALLNALPVQRKTIFRMRFHEDRSTGDIADQLGLSKKTVQNQLSLAFDQLRVSLIHLFAVIIIIKNIKF